MTRWAPPVIGDPVPMTHPELLEEKRPKNCAHAAGRRRLQRSFPVTRCSPTRSQLLAVQHTPVLSDVQAALAKSPTLPPLPAPDAPSLASTATFVGSLLTAAGAMAWLLLPRVL